MSQNFRFNTYENRVVFLSMLLIFGLISSHAIISVATGLFFANFLFLYARHKFNFFNKSNSVILSYVLFFIPFLLLLPFSPNLAQALKSVSTKLPWLVLPLAFAALPTISASKRHLIYIFFTLVMVVSGAVVLTNFLGNYAYYVDEISRGKNIPMPLGHVRYSLMVVFAGLLSLYQFIKNESRISAFDRQFYAFAAIFLFVMVHLINVRIAWVVYYVGLLYLILYFAVLNKKYWLPVVALAVLLILPFAAYKTIPSFKNRIDYMRYDWGQMYNKEVGFYSDTRRFLSNKMALNMLKQKAAFGYGVGNVDAACMAYYDENLPEVKQENRKLPHMQFLFTAVETGIFGLLFLIVALILPLIASLWFKNPLYVVLGIILVLSCLADQTLESQVGVSFFLLMGCLQLKTTHD